MSHLACLAQQTTPDGDCPLAPLPTLSHNERKELKENLDSYIDLWKTIGPSGDNPTLAFVDMDEKHIALSAEYKTTDSAVANAKEQYDWCRVAALYDASHSINVLNDIFDMVARLGMDVVIHALWKGDQTESLLFCAYDNATLRRIMDLENHIQAYIFADAMALRHKTPMPVDDSLFLTSVSYCNHLYTLHLHSTAADDPTVSSQFAWMISNKFFIEGNPFFHYVGADTTTLRIVGSIEGSRDTVTLDYRPAQLLGEEPAIDVDLAGHYLAMAIGRNCPQPLDDSSGIWTHCSYDPSLRVVVMHYTVEELAILAVDGKEKQMKEPMLENIIYADGAEFLALLTAAEVGLELRWQSRTTGRKITITYTPDELINYMSDEE
ncbi:MAG: hypothetical protein IJ634_00510 [Bacteroidales bacterium]|nr:hypothetical protein [Bacteroidales bacterium]